MTRHDDMLDRIMDEIDDALADADVWQPAGRGAGYSVSIDEAFLRQRIGDLLLKTNAPAVPEQVQAPAPARNALARFIRRMGIGA